MTLTEILNDPALRNREFPVTGERIFLAHAAVSPLPRRVAQAISDYALRSATNDPEVVLPNDLIRRTRERAAELIGADAGEIALIGPTSLALSMVAAGMRFRRHEHVLVYQDDYPSNVYPWMALADRGVEVRFLNVRELGLIRPRDVLGQVDENTRLVALASCHFISGHRLDIETIGRTLRERNIRFCLDAIQTAGAFPTPVEHVDYLAADSHKWLLGPAAGGFLYVRREAQEQLEPATWGWHNLKCPDFVTDEQLVFRGDARRYEAGSHNLLGLVGLCAALELSLEIGVEAIAARLQHQRRLLVAALREKACTVLNPDPAGAESAGIVSFWREGERSDLIRERLTAAGVVSSLRTDRQGRRMVRFSPHYYITDGELLHAVEAV